MSEQYLEIHVDNKVGHIILNRPEKRNAFNAELISAMQHAFDAALENADIKVVVLKAHGDVFSAGADLAYLQELQNNSFEENLADSERLATLYKTIFTFPKPVIAQVQGHAIAGGCGLASVCDICYAVPEAKFGYTEVNIGFVPALVTVFLLRKLSDTHVRDLVLTGKLIPADEAARIGLITRVVDADKLQAEVDVLCQQIVEGVSRKSMSVTKELLHTLRDAHLDEELKIAARFNATMRETEDCKKGIASFLEKKKISWD
ncbi:MAG: enoyl-CoA hydratase-related protein [Chitinophagales bacterium]